MPKPVSSGFDAGADVLRAHLKTIPSQAGVYRMLSGDGAVLYVGKAKNLKKRVSSYTQRARLANRLQRMVARIRDVEIVVTRTESEALLLEANLIRRFMPPYNVLLRDDKSFPYIMITKDHPFPQIAKHRGAQERKGWYFGPFASGRAVTETLLMLQRAFMLRTCSNSYFDARTRPCLQYHIKRCTAPCCQKVSKSAYDRQVQDAVSFLKGKTQDVQKEMAEAMESASDSLDFEKAAVLRDRIKALTAIQSRQDIHAAGLGDADVIGLYQEGGRTAIQLFFFRSSRNFGTRSFFPIHDAQIAPEEILSAFISQFYSEVPPPPLLLVSHRPSDDSLIETALSERTGRKVRLLVPKQDKKKHLVDHALLNAAQALARKMSESKAQKQHLDSVAKLFGLKKPPKRIEVYDNSHISGRHAVGAMIVAGPEGFMKKEYRKFTIRQADGQDDFGMMREVLTRRLDRLAPDNRPDLILIDGGAGQIGKVSAVLTEMGVDDIPLVGIAKGPDRNAGRERFFISGRSPFSLPEKDPTLYFLQRLRDEAHRFAIGTHRSRRQTEIRKTGLEEIEGIGTARKKALLGVFGSAKAVAEASLEDLGRVAGISRALAKKIYDYYHTGV